MAVLGLSILALFLLIGPVLALIAWIRVEQLRKSRSQADDGELRARVEELERQVVALRRQRGTAIAAEEMPTAEPPASPEKHAPPAQAPPEPPAGEEKAPARSWRDLDLESLIAGRWLNRIGILILLLGAAFFLRFAFENDWVGPRGRVAIGLVSGAALLVYAQWLVGRGLRYFAEGMTALGIGVIYLSVYAAWGFYSLIPQPAAFGALIVVTAAIVALSVRQDSQRLAALALVGGFLTPGLLSTGSDAQMILFTYLAILGAGLLLIGYLRGFRVLGPASLVATIGYFAAWYDRFYEPDRLLSTALFGTLFFALYFSLPLVRLRSLERVHPEEVFVLLANLAAFVVLLERLLYDEHRWLLTAAVLALGVLHLGVAVTFGRETGAGRRPALRLLFAGLALTLATIAVPIRLDGDWITLAWAIEAAVLVATGFRISSGWMRAAGGLLFGLVLFLLPAALDGAPDQRLFLNLRFATLMAFAISLTVSFLASRRWREGLHRVEAWAYAAGVIVANLVALVAFSFEAWDFVGTLELGVDRRLARQFALSLLWIVWASSLVVTGVLRRVAGLRWQGLALLLVVVAKTFLFDLSFLENQYRILSFLIVGTLLLAVSFVYQRRLRASEAGGAE